MKIIFKGFDLDKLLKTYMASLAEKFITKINITLKGMYNSSSASIFSRFKLTRWRTEENIFSFILLQ